MATKPAIGEFAVNGFNLAAVIRKTGEKCAAGEWETICTVQSADWKELAQLFAAASAMRKALKEIAKQVPAKDMDEDYYDAADFEHGYDSLIFIARAALSKTERV